MEPADRTEKNRPLEGVETETGAPAAGTNEESPRFGPAAAQILATEHWSLLATRSLIWNEALSRASVFLTVLSAAIVSLALLADATGFGPETVTLALVLLPIVFLLGIGAYARLVQINTEEFQVVLAMNRLRRAYLELEPGLEPYFTTGHHDDELGMLTTYMLYRPSRLWMWIHFVVNTPTIVATVDAALAAAMVALALQLANAPLVAVMAAAGVVFLAIWCGLYLLQFRILSHLIDQEPRFPSPADDPAAG
jgi:hypothetical protein